MADWVVYILRCADHTLYTGISNDLPARIACHHAGRGAKYLRGRLPAVLVYSETAIDRAAASRREHAIKRLDARAKQRLILSAKSELGDSDTDETESTVHASRSNEATTTRPNIDGE